MVTLLNWNSFYVCLCFVFTLGIAGIILIGISLSLSLSHVTFFELYIMNTLVRGRRWRFCGRQVCNVFQNNAREKHRNHRPRCSHWMPLLCLFALMSSTFPQEGSDRKDASR
ncbi:uncharacterized protein TM35_000084220 [Trypanosoma theileri]|uniref:Uncharacterized protein n=1 Tax=Trypanosoma theileri TaxID=67003 RepID=A0A1X0P109_9TRYP|nr:uncharacterized protein TM35_000084220 [Trypanosoma theileri]ORC90624.1 hypothetical protein TM35_000084220 [Trypanosoma theileri]